MSLNARLNKIERGLGRARRRPLLQASNWPVQGVDPTGGRWECRELDGRPVDLGHPWAEEADYRYTLEELEAAAAEQGREPMLVEYVEAWRIPGLSEAAEDVRMNTEPLFRHGGRYIFADMHDRRLARLFADVWRKIPRRNKITLLSRLGAGQIILITDWAKYLSPGHCVELGGVQFAGRNVIRFFVDPLNHANRSAADVRHTFAHEFAHLWRQHLWFQRGGRTRADWPVRGAAAQVCLLRCAGRSRPEYAAR